jgi:uncharacterized protein YecA (UPF0149 family)
MLPSVKVNRASFVAGAKRASVARMCTDDIELTPEENDRFWAWLSERRGMEPSHLDMINTMLRALPVDKDPGRNDPCNCGSGLKYKKCCGK